MHQPLAEDGLLTQRHDKRVNNDVVNKISPDRTGIAEVIDLDWSRPVSEDCGPGEPGVALEVNQNVDSVAMDQLGRMPVRRVANIDKAIKGAGDASAHRASVVGPEE
jgi:hypothetical protein